MDTETAPTLAGMETDRQARVDPAAIYRLPVYHGRGNATFIDAAIPLAAEAARARPLETPPRIGKRHATRHELHDRGRASAERPACLRRGDGIDPGYRA